METLWYVFDISVTYANKKLVKAKSYRNVNFISEQCLKKVNSTSKRIVVFMYIVINSTSKYTVVQIKLSQVACIKN